MTDTKDLEELYQFDLENNIAKVLETRRTKTNGFAAHAKMSRALKNTMSMSTHWSHLSDDKLEALEMMSYNIGVILNGGSDEKAPWESIRMLADAIVSELTSSVA